jgi:hypothetical protein
MVQTCVSTKIINEGHNPSMSITDHKDPKHKSEFFQMGFSHLGPMLGYDPLVYLANSQASHTRASLGHNLNKYR